MATSTDFFVAIVFCGHHIKLIGYFGLLVRVQMAVGFHGSLYPFMSQAFRNQKRCAAHINQQAGVGMTYDVINKMTALKPKDGSTYVSDAQKLRVIVDSGLSEKDMVKLVQSTSIGKTMKTRLPILVDNGVSITKQLQFWEKIFDFDADGSGKLNQREVRACLDSFPGGNNNPLEALMGITSSSGPAWTTAEKAAMWQSYNKQFSARKNPYDRKVGENPSQIQLLTTQTQKRQFHAVSQSHIQFLLCTFDIGSHTIFQLLNGVPHREYASFLGLMIFYQNDWVL